MEDLISIIVPVYNVEQYLDKCLESLTNQTYKNLEIILIDDGSTDSSGKICDEWKQKDKRIIVKHIKNSGVSNARNIGIDISKGKYIGFIDSDDYVDFDMYEMLLKNMIEHDANISICSSYHVYENGKIIHDKIENINEELDSIQGLMCIFKQGYYGTGMCNKLFNKELLLGNYFSTSLSCGEELNVLFNAVKNSKKIYYSSIPKYYYYQRSESATHKRKLNTGMMDNFVAILAANNEFIENNIELKKCIISSYILSCFQVFNRSIIYNDITEKFTIARNELFKYKNMIDYSNYNVKKRIQLFIFFKFNLIYIFILKIFTSIKGGGV